MPAPSLPESGGDQGVAGREGLIEDERLLETNTRTSLRARVRILAIRA